MADKVLTAWERARELVHQVKLREGEKWFVVSASWWRKFERAARAMGPHDDTDEDDPLADNFEDEKDEELGPIRNEKLVETAFSSKERQIVVLQPELAEESDYRIVSEPVWTLLKESFGFDWEIAREVVACGPNRRLLVDVYPLVFQLFFWHDELPRPTGFLDPQQAPLLLLLNSSLTLEQLEDRVDQFLRQNELLLKQTHPQLLSHPQFHKLFSRIFADSERGVSLSSKPLRLAFRRAFADKWEAFPMSLTLRLEELKLDQLPAPDDNDPTTDESAIQDPEDRFCGLLLETQFGESERAPIVDNTSMQRDHEADVDGLSWRHGLFFSEMEAQKWRYELAIGDLVDAQDSMHKWYESRVMELTFSSVKVHYRGWTAKWDEWLDRTSTRLAPLHTKVRNWRQFRVGDRVQVGRDVPNRSFPEWRNATVTQVEVSSFSGDLKIRVHFDGSYSTSEDEFVDSQSELLCEPRVHKVVNATTTTTTNATSTSANHMVTNSSWTYSDHNRSVQEAGTRYGAMSSSRARHRGSYGPSEPRGVVGLQNLGNTCFMNSMLQCLMNTKPLVEFFLAMDPVTQTPCFERDLNRTNPLGMKGQMAQAFARLLAQMWCPPEAPAYRAVVAPQDLKYVIGQYAPQFAGYQQQDSQELMSFLLDGLHEDLNRVQEKPYLPAVEHNGREDAIVAAEEWHQFKKRNDSVIVDNFMGQLRSHVTCCQPDCGHQSITFDPFMSLSVPIPVNDTIDLQLKLFWANGRIPTKYLIQVARDVPLREVKRQLSCLSEVPMDRLLFVQVLRHRIEKAYRENLQVEHVQETTIHAYELENPLNDYHLCSRNLFATALGGPASMGSSSSSSFAVGKPKLLVTLLHQAPCASASGSAPTSPVDQVAAATTTHHQGEQEDPALGQSPGEAGLTGRSSMALQDEQEEAMANATTTNNTKQRRVEVELINTPLVVSIDRDVTKRQVHSKIWLIVRRLVETEADFGCESGRMLPYRLHLADPTTGRILEEDLPRNDELLAANAPSEAPHTPQDDLTATTTSATTSATLSPSPSPSSFCFVVEWSRRGFREGYNDTAAKRVELHESMSNLRIDNHVNEQVTLSNCLSSFTEREQLAKTDTWFCPKCQQHVRAFKKFDLFALPKVLIFHLKRFRYANTSFYMRRDKISTLVQFPIGALELAPFVVGPQAQHESLVYDLFAVSEHSGGLGGGHYTATAKNPETGKWYSFNDSFVSPTSAESSVTSRAYVLFYIRRESETSGVVNGAKKTGEGGASAL